VSQKPSVPIRLIALDLDGTLLRSDHTVGARSIAALRAAQAQGVEIVLASGRMTPAMEPTATALGLDVVLVSYNGAAVCGRVADGRERMFHRPLQTDVAGELYAFARQERLQINYYLDDVIVSEDGPHLRPWIDIYRDRTGSPYRFVESLEGYLHREPTKLLMVMEPTRREEVAEVWKAKLGARADVVKTDPEYLEFLAPGADKGAAITYLARARGFGLDAVMAMGNGENDVPMLKRAGLSVAVSNACGHCRDAAQHVTENDHDHDAVAEAVERWVLG